LIRPGDNVIKLALPANVRSAPQKLAVVAVLEWNWHVAWHNVSPRFWQTVFCLVQE
jgi:hypothetical protein